MATTINSLLGVHEQALIYRSKRAEVLASNMANADTPGYKARDFDFKAVLSRLNTPEAHVKTTHSKHLGFDKTPKMQWITKHPYVLLMAKSRLIYRLSEENKHVFI